MSSADISPPPRTRCNSGGGVYIRQLARLGLVFQLGEEWFSSNLGQIGHGAGVLDKFFQGGRDDRTSKEFAEEVDLAPKLIVWNWLNEFFGGSTRDSVVLGDLRGGRAGDAEDFAFTGKLRYEAHGLRASRVDRSPGEKQIPYESIAKIALQARDAAEARDESQAQFGKCKPRHLVGDDHVTGQGQLKSSTKTSAMNGSDGDKWGGIYRVQNGMDAFKKGAHACGAFFCGNGRRGGIQLAQIAAGGKNGLSRTRKNADGRLRYKHIKCSNKFFQLRKHGRANFIGRLMIKRQFDHAFAPFPTQRFASESFHACCLLTASQLPFESYMALISDAYRALMASRRSLPLAVSSPFSGAKTSRMIVKLRI